MPTQIRKDLDDCEICTLFIAQFFKKCVNKKNFVDLFNKVLKRFNYATPDDIT